MKQQYPSIDDLIAQERNSIGGVDRWTSAGYGLVVGEKADSVTFEQAVQTAKAICPNVNMYAEYTDAYVFSQKEDLSFGGNSPLVILKVVRRLYEHDRLSGFWQRSHSQRFFTAGMKNSRRVVLLILPAAIFILCPAGDTASHIFAPRYR